MAKLRIKADKDLKELEKFGFNHLPARDKWQIYGEEWYIDIYEDCSIAIDCRDVSWVQNIVEILNVFYDLIQADLVEKVEEGE